jgi:hypothetical protein
MIDFVIDPPIRILGRHASFVRSTKEAAAFLREHMDVNAPKVLQNLEGVVSVKEPQEAAKAFRSWIANRVETTSGVALVFFARADRRLIKKIFDVPVAVFRRGLPAPHNPGQA